MSKKKYIITVSLFIVVIKALPNNCRFTYILGMLLGLFIGYSVKYFYARWNKENNLDKVDE